MGTDEKARCISADEEIGTLTEECEVKKDSRRQSWNNKVEYLLAMVGNAVGIGNIWRFPYQCQKHGGGAFLIPYFTVLLLIGYPMLLMEIALGQKYQCGAIAMWGQISPYAAGIGISTLVIVAFLTSYYAVVLSWSFVYAANSFQSPLPWNHCPKVFDDASNSSVVVQECAASSPSVYYWFRQTLNVPNSIEESHVTINWQILLACLFSSILLFIGLQKGVKSTGKFMYFGVLFPYVVLFTFLVRALTLEGSHEGIAYLIRTDMTKLGSLEVWQAATTQIFFSIGIGYGVYVAQASYMPKGNNCKFDVIFVATVNSFTSILATLIVFGILGFRAHVNQEKCYAEYATTLNISVEDLLLNTTNSNDVALAKCSYTQHLDKVKGGTGLAFIAFAEAIVSFPVSNLWSLIFYLMLGSVGLSSVIGTLTGVIASLRDVGCKTKKPIIAALLCGGLFVFTIIYTTDFGYYFIDILDNNIGGLALCPVVLFEVIATSYLYGINRFMEDIKNMTGKKPGKYWWFTLAISSPILLTLFIVLKFINYGLKGSLTYKSWNKEETIEMNLPYPTWGYAAISISSLVCVLSMPLAIVLYKLNVFNLAEYLTADKKEKQNTSLKLNDFSKQRLDF